MEISLIKKMKDNKQIFVINEELDKYLLKIVNNVIVNYRGIPETTEGLYWEFLYEVPKLINEFVGEDKYFKTYIGTKCKFFVMNKCKTLSTKVHSVMNNFIPIQDEDKNRFMADSIELSDTNKNTEIDLSLLTELELEIYKMHFIEGQNIYNISKTLNMTRYKVTSTIQSASLKLNDKRK